MKIEIDGLIFDSKKLISVEKYDTKTIEYRYPKRPKFPTSLVDCMGEKIIYYLKLTLESSNGNYFNRTLEYQNESVRDEKYEKIHDLIEKDGPILKL